MDDLRRIEAEYTRRTGESSYQSLYSALNFGNLQAIHSRERALMRLLRRQGLHDLSKTRVLDVGCGSGGELLRWMGYGVPPENCVGIDLMPNRVAAARERLPSSARIQQGDASALPYEQGEFDIVTQFTVFSSILDDHLRQRIAAEMRRVVRPGGFILWYDFWWNPKNKQTRGIRMPEIRALYPNCNIDARLVTLAPPIARRVAPVSMLLADALELLPLRTHWLACIRT